MVITALSWRKKKERPPGCCREPWQMEDLIDLTQTALDEAWKADGGGGARGAYPQARMAHLLDVIGAAICR